MSTEVKIIEQTNGGNLVSGPADRVYVGATVGAFDGTGLKMVKVLKVLKAGDKDGVPWAVASFSSAVIKRRMNEYGSDPQDNQLYWEDRVREDKWEIENPWSS